MEKLEIEKKAEISIEAKSSRFHFKLFYFQKRNSINLFVARKPAEASRHCCCLGIGANLKVWSRKVLFGVQMLIGDQLTSPKVKARTLGSLVYQVKR